MINEESVQSQIREESKSQMSDESDSEIIDPKSQIKQIFTQNTKSLRGLNDHPKSKHIPYKPYHIEHESVKMFNNRIDPSSSLQMLENANAHLIQPTPRKNDKEHEHQLAKYRRKGIKKQRRLSRMNIGKHLALSDTSELKMQWIVDFKDI